MTLRHVLRRLGIVAAMAFAGALWSNNGALAREYCADGGISVERADLSASEIGKRCKAAADLFGWKALPTGKSCTICDPGQVRVASPPVKKKPPTGKGKTGGPDPAQALGPLPKLSGGLKIVGSPTRENSCATNYPGKLYDAVKITTNSSTLSNCPAPYITSGWNGDYTPNLRMCAFCGAGYKKSKLQWGCCELSQR